MCIRDRAIIDICLDTDDEDGQPDVLEPAVPEPAVPEPEAPEPAVPEPEAPEPAAPEPAAPELAAPELAAPELAAPEPAVGAQHNPNDEGLIKLLFEKRRRQKQQIQALEQELETIEEQLYEQLQRLPNGSDLE